MGKHIRYFAYGSNMSVRRLLDRVPGAAVSGSGRLSGHELRFHKRSRDGSGKCNAFSTQRESAVVFGALFDIPVAEKALLDRLEGLKFGYKEKTVIVLRPDGTSEDAVTYYAVDIDDALKPFTWYKDHVLIGAREGNLPADYIMSIEAVEAVYDNSAERERKERAIYS